MKIAPLLRELEKRPNLFRWELVHTGQHYDQDMSKVFFEELGIPEPHHYLEAGGGSHAEQTARIMVRYEAVCAQDPPDLTVVVGDVNSTLAASIVAKKLGIKVAHIEAGLRSGDMTMPEEVNRIVTDSITDYFFVTEESAIKNLTREGHLESAIHFVGHVMIDNLFYQLQQLDARQDHPFPSESPIRDLKKYGVVTLHRPSNVDDPVKLGALLSCLGTIAAELRLVFPMHPRTRANVEKFGLRVPDGIHVMTPLPYMEFLNLWRKATLVLTDSGGIQEETTGLGIPCITLRENTERPVTVAQGTNRLVGTDPSRIIAAARAVLAGGANPAGTKPPLWDGRASIRIVDALEGLVRSGSLGSRAGIAVR